MGQRLLLFRAIGNNKYQCRCPLCGDSKKDKKKARGNFFMYKGSWLYKCHNCGKSLRIPTMLETAFPDLFDEYVMGKHRERVTQKAKPSTTQKAIISTTRNPIKDIVIDLPKLSDLPDDHPAVTYAKDRKLPTKYLADLYYAKEFNKWSNTIVPGFFANTNFDSERIVIPFRDEKGRLFAFQGRAINPSKIKYLTVKIEADAQKIFGLDKIDKSKPIYVVEGPFDSFFIENCLGTADSSLDSIDGIYIWDNEPRSPIICKKIENAINNGSSVVIWKKSNKFNDINDAIQKFGYDIAKMNALVKKRTFQGLLALVELNNWRKT